MLDLKTCVLTLHVAGLVLGLGTAVFLDLHLLRSRARPLRPADAELLESGAALVSLGLLVLWITGLGLVALAWARDPAALGNPKLHAKLLIVLALTLNGVLLHQRVLPLIRRQLGRHLFAGMTRGELRLALGCGAISTGSWGTAFLLGMVREFNGAAPVATFLAAWVGSIVLAWVAASALCHSDPPERAAAMPECGAS